MVALAVALLSVGKAVVNIKMPGHFTIPTPFYKKPFEFIVGFRRQLFLLLPAFVLGVVAVCFNNFNLGLFSQAVVFLICTSFYSEPEDDFYVWIHRMNSQQFLGHKIKTALLFSTILAMPVAVLLLAFFPRKHGLSLLFNCWVIVTSLL